MHTFNLVKCTLLFVVMDTRMRAHRKHFSEEVSTVKTVHWVFTVERSGSNSSALIHVMIKEWHWVWPGLGLTV